MVWHLFTASAVYSCNAHTQLIKKNILIYYEFNMCRLHSFIWGVSELYGFYFLFLVGGDGLHLLLYTLISIK